MKKLKSFVYFRSQCGSLPRVGIAVLSLHFTVDSVDTEERMEDRLLVETLS